MEERGKPPVSPRPIWLPAWWANSPRFRGSWAVTTPSMTANRLRSARPSPTITPPPGRPMTAPPGHQQAAVIGAEIERREGARLSFIWGRGYDRSSSSGRRNYRADVIWPFPGPPTARQDVRWSHFIKKKPCNDNGRSWFRAPNIHRNSSFSRSV